MTITTSPVALRLLPDEATTDTELRRWHVQSGKGKGKYTTRWSFTSMTQAHFYYASLNVGNGYKKRLLDTQRNLVFARMITQVWE